jgi:hypothetical protein
VTLKASARSAPKGMADPVASRIEVARGLLEARRAAEALIPAQQAAAMAPASTEAAELLDQVQAALATGDPALVKLELTAVLNPDDAANQLALGEAYAAANRPQDAERCFKQALTLGRVREAHANLAGLYLSVDMPEAADHHARLVLSTPTEGRDDDTLTAMAYQTLAATCRLRGEHDEAEHRLDLAYARQSLYRQPAPGAAFTTLVLVSRRAGNIPYASLMPRDGFDRTVWYMEHARPEQIADLGAYGIVLNAIGDPDIALASRWAVDEVLDRCGKPVLNPPDRVETTFRHRIGETLSGIDGLITPRTIRLSGAEIAAGELKASVARAGFAGPVIVRPTGSHGGEGLALVRDANALGQIKLPGDSGAYVTAFHDYRSADGFYRKYRMIFVDRTPYAYHLAIGRQWMVHHRSAEMQDDGMRIAEELAFLRDPETAIGKRAMAALRAIGRRLDLDYGGIDFSLTEDGQVLLFEANATMLTHLEPADGPFAAKNVYIAPILQAFQVHLTARATGG